MSSLVMSTEPRDGIAVTLFWEGGELIENVRVREGAFVHIEWAVIIDSGPDAFGRSYTGAWCGAWCDEHRAYEDFHHRGIT